MVIKYQTMLPTEYLLTPTETSDLVGVMEAMLTLVDVLDKLDWLFFLPLFSGGYSWLEPLDS